MMRVICLALLLSAQGAIADTYRFTWYGGGGYTMSGAVAFAASGGKGLLTEDDVQCFEITGFRNGQQVGRWALAQLTPTTDWTLLFDPTGPRFVVSDGTGPSMPQAWNMNGLGVNCGPGGFGFNLGNAAQDICLNDRLVIESQIASATPLPAMPAPDHVFSQDACRGGVVVSRTLR